MPFSTRITVRFADVDAAGLVYYPVLFHYCHVAMEEFFAARCGVTYDRLMSVERIGFPTVNAKAEFFAPLVYEKRRETWSLAGAEVVIDELPFGLFVEIEGDEPDILKAEKLLGLDSDGGVQEPYPTLTLRHGTERDGVVEARFSG